MSFSASLCLQLTFKESYKKEMSFLLRVWNNKKPVNSATPISSPRSTPRRSIEKSMERTPKSARRIVLGRSSEEMRELPAPPAARRGGEQAAPSSSRSGSTLIEREKEARV